MKQVHDLYLEGEFVARVPAIDGVDPVESLRQLLSADPQSIERRLLPAHQLMLVGYRRQTPGRTDASGFEFFIESGDGRDKFPVTKCGTITEAEAFIAKMSPLLPVKLVAPRVVMEEVDRSAFLQGVGG